jgi:uncharacterized protein (DUF1015 family)
VISDGRIVTELQTLFGRIPKLYVADGHHRTAAAAIVGRERKALNPRHSGNEEYNFFLAVCFPSNQLRILDYNRVVKDLLGLHEDEFRRRIDRNFTVRDASSQVRAQNKGEFGMYLGNKWYLLVAHKNLVESSDPVLRLDVSILQNCLLDPVLGVKDPRTDKRIDFVGGIRGLGELERRVNSGEMKVAFSLHPTSVDELMSIADAGKVMPPKSTWFEPKLRDGLFTHFLD